MFVVVRSLFWLTVAYMVIKPGVPLPDPAELAGHALSASRQMVTEQVANTSCETLACTGSKLLVASALAVPSQAETQPIQQKLPAIPLPRPRPAGAG